MMKLSIRNLLQASLLLSVISCGGESDTNGSSGTGTAGSLAKFTIANNNLYVLDWRKVSAFSLADPINPQLFDNIYVANGETLFNHQGSHLLAGKNDGVDIIELNEEGEMTIIAEHSHMTACDPVVAEGNLAYVTTRGGNRCFGGINQVEILDITDMANPQAIYSMGMTAPSGLAVSGDNLFICDISDGLQRFTIVESVIDSTEQVSLTNAYVNDVYPCNDIIINGDHLILKHPEGITQIRWQGDEYTVLSELAIEQ